MARFKPYKYDQMAISPFRFNIKSNPAPRNTHQPTNWSSIISICRSSRRANHLHPNHRRANGLTPSPPELHQGSCRSRWTLCPQNSHFEGMLLQPRAHQAGSFYESFMMISFEVVYKAARYDAAPFAGNSSFGCSPRSSQGRSG